MLTSEREASDLLDVDPDSSASPRQYAPYVVSIKYWRSRLGCMRLPFSYRGRYDLSAVSYTTDIERVRGVKVDLRGGEDFRKTKSEQQTGRKYLDKSLSVMKGTNMLSRITALKWFKFQVSYLCQKILEILILTGVQQHCFKMQLKTLSFDII